MRFRTVDVSNPDQILANDVVTLAIHSNGDLPSSFCDYTGLSIDPNTAMRGSRPIQVSDERPAALSIPVLTQIQGWDAVRAQPGCYEMLWVALEFRHPSGRWEEIQWEDVDRTSAPENQEYSNILGSTNSRIYF
jgi:hypothetical protein